MRDEALHAAERLGERETSEVARKDFDRRRSTCNLEAHHRAESRLLRTRDVVARMRGKSRIVHARNGMMTTQEIDDGGGALEMIANARLERPNAAEREITIEGRAGDPEAVCPPREL